MHTNLAPDDPSRESASDRQSDLERGNKLNAIAPGVIPDAAAITVLQQRVASMTTEHNRIIQDALHKQAEWKKRWAAETAAFDAQIAEQTRKIAAEEQALKDAEARLLAIDAEDKAAAAQELRERAAQAAADAAQKTPATQQASDF